MDEKHMTTEQRKMASRIDTIYSRQGDIQKKMQDLMDESKKLRKENELLLKKLGWW